MQRNYGASIRSRQVRLPGAPNAPDGRGRIFSLANVAANLQEIRDCPVRDFGLGRINAEQDQAFRRLTGRSDPLFPRARAFRSSSRRSCPALCAGWGSASSEGPKIDDDTADERRSGIRLRSPAAIPVPRWRGARQGLMPARPTVPAAGRSPATAPAAAACLGPLRRSRGPTVARRGSRAG